MVGRFQLPTLAKFNRPDPMRDWNWLAPHTVNLYECVYNDPVLHWDPSGLGTWEVLLGYANQAVDDAKGAWNAAKYVATTNPMKSVPAIGAGLRDTVVESADTVFDFYRQGDRLERLNDIVLDMDDEEAGRVIFQVLGTTFDIMSGGAKSGLKATANAGAEGAENAIERAVLKETASEAGEAVTKGANGLTKEAQKGIRSLEKGIAEHEKKLADFKANPTVRPGMEGQPESVIKAAQESRIRHLEKEIQTFGENIEKLKEGGQ